MVQWSGAFAVGHAMIDAQHRELFRRHAQLLEAMKRGDKAEIGRLFDFLGSYVVEHFDEEEQLMKTSGYPAAALHCVAHAAFVREYRSLRAEYEAQGASAAVCIRVKTWLGDWIAKHIAKADHGLALFLQQTA